jgi:hypothetical protein
MWEKITFSLQKTEIPRKPLRTGMFMAEIGGSSPTLDNHILLMVEEIPWLRINTILVNAFILEDQGIWITGLWHRWIFSGRGQYHLRSAPAFPKSPKDTRWDIWRGIGKTKLSAFYLSFKRGRLYIYDPPAQNQAKVAFLITE